MDAGCGAWGLMDIVESKKEELEERILIRNIGG